MTSGNPRPSPSAPSSPSAAQPSASLQAHRLPALPSRADIIERRRIVDEFARQEVDRDHARDVLIRTGMDWIDADRALDFAEEEAS